MEIETNSEDVIFEDYEVEDILDHKGLIVEDSFYLHSRFLALVEPMKQNYADKYDRCIPVVKMRGENEPTKLVVVNVNDIQEQVGLVRSSPLGLEYKVVAPYMIYDTNISQNAGSLRYF
ncbi:unnamed protein product [Mucor hiemalis]